MNNYLMFMFSMVFAYGLVHICVDIVGFIKRNKRNKSDRLRIENKYADISKIMSSYNDFDDYDKPKYNYKESKAYTLRIRSSQKRRNK